MDFCNYELMPLRGYELVNVPGTGETLFHNLETGELSRPMIVPGDGCHLSAQVIERNRKFREMEKKLAEKEAMRKAKIRFEKELGHFFFLRFDRNAPVGISSGTLARLIYLASFLNYDNQLMATQRIPLTKEGVKEKLHLSSTTFYRFWNEVTARGLICDDDEGHLTMSSAMFFRGETPAYTGYECGWVKIYISQIRKLYEVTPTSKHQYIGAIFLMLPFINLKHNILCYNPFEENLEQIRPLAMSDMCRILGVVESNATRFREEYQQLLFTTEETIQRFCTVAISDSEAEFLCINPRIVFMGNNWRFAEEQIASFKEYTPHRKLLKTVHPGG